VNPDVDGYRQLKPEITGKHSEKRKKQQLTENQTNTEYQNTS